MSLCKSSQKLKIFFILIIIKIQNFPSLSVKLTKKRLPSKKTKKQKPISVKLRTNPSSINSKSNKKIMSPSPILDKPQKTDKNQEPSNPMDEEIKPNQIQNQTIQDSKLNQSKVVEKEQIMNQNEKDMLQGYIEAIKYLENPKNSPQIKSILESQINYLRATECSVCCQNFDTQKKKPMMVCLLSSSHVICSSCLQKEPNINKSSRCYICRRSIKREDVKVDDEILTWLKVNKRLGIQAPTLYGSIPKELYESLRKISFHDLAKIQTKRNIEEGQKIKFETMKFKMVNIQIQSHITQKKLELKQIEQKLKVSLESCEAIRKQLESMRMNAIYQSSSSLDSKEFFINHLKLKKKEMDIDFQFLGAVYSKYKELIPQMLQHQKQKHQGESLYRIDRSLCMYYDNKNETSYCYFKKKVPEECQECKIFIKQAQKKIKNLEVLRHQYLKNFNQYIKKHSYMVLFVYQSFLPKTVEQFRQDRKKYFHFVDKQQVSILEEIFSQKCDKMDIHHFYKMLKTESIDSSQQNKKAQMQNDENVEKIQMSK